MTKRETAMKIAWLINDEGHSPSTAVGMVGLDTEGDDCGAFGEDIGDECLDLDDPDSDVIDLGWEDDGHTHFQLKRRYSTALGRKVWEVERMQLLTEDGKELPTPEPLGDPPAELADAWARYQRGDNVEGWELSKLDEWRADCAEAAGY